MNLGLSGRLTRATIRSPLTPLILLAAIVFGLIALVTIPREEEPQISVPMVDIFVQANGLKAPDAAELVTKPLEEIVKGINGVEHVYSQTQDDRVLVTARFFTGTSEDDAILRVQAKLRGNYDRIPLGIPEPLIVGRGINDVAIVVLTLSPKPNAASRWDEKDLYTLAEKVQAELTKVDNIGLTYIAGGSTDEISVQPDPEKLALFGVTLQQLEAKIQGANRSFLAGQLRENGTHVRSRRRANTVGRTRYRASPGHDARRTPCLRARSGEGDHRAQPGRALYLVDGRVPVTVPGQRFPPSAWPSRSARALMRLLFPRR